MEGEGDKKRESKIDSILCPRTLHIVFDCRFDSVWRCVGNRQARSSCTSARYLTLVKIRHQERKKRKTKMFFKFMVTFSLMELPFPSFKIDSIFRKSTRPRTAHTQPAHTHARARKLKYLYSLGNALNALMRNGCDCHHSGIQSERTDGEKKRQTARNRNCTFKSIPQRW